MLAAAILIAPITQAAAQTLPARDFARHAGTYSVSLSPAGNFVAVSTPNEDNTETTLHVIKLDGTGDTQILRFGKQQHVSDVMWSDDEQLVVSRAKLKPLKALPESYGELMTTNVKGHNQDTLFAWNDDSVSKRGRRKDQGFAYVAKVLRQEPGKIIVGFTCWESVCGEEPPTTIYKVDTLTGHREQVEHVDEPAGFDFDKNGRARIMTTNSADDQPVLQYRPTADSEWKPMPKSLAGRTVGRTWFAPDNNTVYAVVSDHGEPGQLYKLDLAAGTRQKLLGRDDVEISGFMYEGYGGAPFAVIYDADKPSIQYLDQKSEWAQLHLAILKQFPGQMATILNASRDGQKVLFSVWSDRHPAAWYVFDRQAKQVQLIAESEPWIKPSQMASTRPVAFTSRDGKQLFGFYTAKGDGLHPMVVMPHGGPYGPYDSWGYDPEVQFLANRGYGVLQVNFRGSGGRGFKFETDGYREWGGKIQDDIADGVKWAIDQKLADPDRICTYGASFGGYSALMNPIRNPGLYKCAVGYVGVYDLTVMQTAGDIQERKSGRRYISRVLGDDESVLIANSPARQVDKIKLPVMLVAGKDDRRVPMAQFNALTNAFDAAGTPVETLVIDGEGHGFYKTEHKVRLYKMLASFLDKYIGPRSNKK